MKRASSDPIFLAKASTVIEEADESGFWLELLVEVELVAHAKAAPLLKESNELVAIFVATRKRVEERLARQEAASTKAKSAPNRSEF